MVDEAEGHKAYKHLPVLRAALAAHQSKYVHPKRRRSIWALARDKGPFGRIQNNSGLANLPSFGL
jgi:hypothetical protein